MTYIRALIGISWILFWIYWFISATKSKKNVGPFNTRLFFVPRLAILVAIIVLASIFHHIPRYLNDHPLGTNIYVELIGLLLFVSGVGIAIWARVNIAENWGMPMTQKQKPQLVTSGPYKYIRHPIYTGLLTMILGSAIAINDYWIIVFVIAGTFFIYSAIEEEKNLTTQLGNTYVNYKSKTKMLVPFLF